MHNLAYKFGRKYFSNRSKLSILKWNSFLNDSFQSYMHYHLWYFEWKSNLLFKKTMYNKDKQTCDIILPSSTIPLNMY